MAEGTTRHTDQTEKKLEINKYIYRATTPHHFIELRSCIISISSIPFAINIEQLESWVKSWHIELCKLRNAVQITYRHDICNCIIHPSIPLKQVFSPRLDCMMKWLVLGIAKLCVELIKNELYCRKGTIEWRSRFRREGLCGLWYGLWKLVLVIYLMSLTNAYKENILQELQLLPFGFRYLVVNIISRSR